MKGMQCKCKSDPAMLFLAPRRSCRRPCHAILYMAFRSSSKRSYHAIDGFFQAVEVLATTEDLIGDPDKRDLVSKEVLFEASVLLWQKPPPILLHY